MSKQETLRKIGAILVWGLGLWVFFWIAGPILLPFALGYLVARSAAPAARVLQQRTGLPPWLAAGLCMTLLYALVVGSLWALGLLLYEQLSGFARSLPALASALTGPVGELEQWLLALARRFPDGVGQALEQSIRSFFRTGAGLPSRLYQGVFDGVTALVRKLPDLALFLLTAILSSFMLATQLTDLRTCWKARVPQVWQDRLRTWLARIRRTLGSWFHAQLKLMGINCCLFVAGLWILGLDYALLFGLLIALVDALPVFGSGLFLIPWALVQFLRRETVQALGLLGLYGGAALLRTALEPRLLGKQMGMSPLLTLLSLYGGFRFFGIPGMILLPMVVMLTRQVWEN